MIEMENPSKRYGEKLAVDGLDFVVQPGVVTGPPALVRHRWSCQRRVRHRRSGRQDVRNKA